MGHDEQSAERRSNRFELFFYEKVGSRFYLRFTKLALLLIVCLTVVPIALIFTLFLWNQNKGFENININIRSPTPDSHVYPTIQPVPRPPAPPRVGKQLGTSEPPRQAPLVPNGNAGGSLTPSPTPSPTPAMSPT